MNVEAIALVIVLLILWIALDLAVTITQERQND